MTYWTWRWRYWRARHKLLAAQQEYTRWPTPRNNERLHLAARQVVWMELGKP